MARSKKQSPPKTISSNATRTIQKSLRDYFTVQRRNKGFVEGIKSLWRKFGSFSSFSSDAEEEPSEFPIQSLPSAVATRIFNHVSVHDLVSLASVSNETNKLVRDFVVSDDGTSYLRRIAHKAVESGLVATDSKFFFSLIGALVRRCMIHDPASGRRELALHLYKKLFDLFDRNNRDGLLRYLKQVFCDWDDNEKYQFLEGFVQVRLREDVKLAVGNILAGTRALQMELRLREDVHSLFIRDDEALMSKTFGVSAAVRLLSPPNNAHLLLMLLFAPLHCDGGTGQPDSITQLTGSEGPIQSGRELNLFYGGITSAFVELLESPPLSVAALRWRPAEIFTLIEDFTTHPEPWDVDNFAAFLLADARLCLVAVGMRASREYTDDAGRILYFATKMAFLLGQSYRDDLHRALCTLGKNLARSTMKRLYDKTMLRCTLFAEDAWQRGDRTEVTLQLSVTEEVSKLFKHAVKYFPHRA